MKSQINDFKTQNLVPKYTKIKIFRAPPRTPLGELAALPGPPSWWVPLPKNPTPALSPSGFELRPSQIRPPTFWTVVTPMSVINQMNAVKCCIDWCSTQVLLTNVTVASSIHTWGLWLRYCNSVSRATYGTSTLTCQAAFRSRHLVDCFRSVQVLIASTTHCVLLLLDVNNAIPAAIRPNTPPAFLCIVDSPWRLILTLHFHLN